MAAKIFVFGSVNGQLQPAFSKLATLHAKNAFSFAIVTGNLFAEEQDDDQLTALLNGDINIPCSTYFTVGTTALPPRVLERIEKDEDVAHNLHYLGKRSVTKTSEGVRVVSLGGLLDTTIVGGQSKEQHLPYHTEDDAKALRGANNADILLTTVWPAGVWKNSPKAKQLAIDHNLIPASPSIADLCAALKPRYHFAMSPDDFFFEREPFFPETTEGDDKDQGIALTRFISVAPWANAAKTKSMYAFAINRDAIISPPPGSTLTPFYKPATTKKRPADEARFSRFAHHDKDHRRGRKHQRREQLPPPGPDQCFFCLSNPNLPTHMVCCIGNESYLATAKGPLPSAETFRDRGLPFPGHLIITPLAHAPTLSRCDAMSEEEVNTTYAEMKRFRESLQTMVSTQSKRKLGAVTWEISRARNIHVHWQFMPVPAEMVKKGLVEAGFRVLAEDMQLGKFKAEDFETPDVSQGDYLRVWIWAEDDAESGGSSGLGKTLVLRFDENVRFDLQFPRKVMAKLLGLEDRTTWQDVQQSEEEETADVAAFRKAYQEWNFTL
ncbi:CwfJ C-terminus 1-domain-containing protein-like protein [Diplogelasinospora grovesii]|uniref:CwfJ C-terminus 1-domain-containing protein-like protein n=1 Tax=Diplogelasinospora grovesii TaxID=303347 RepID=A0AAN6S5Y8_9PEZI|nr:CwfJ C-terminus 1-domain-containing protein-like protein [Diplogelasinospora grovesii]